MHALRSARADLRALLVVTAVLAILPAILSGSLRTVAVRTLLAAALGVSWNVMGGYAGQFSFGHAAFFGIGAYATAYLSVNAGLSPWIGLLVGVVLAAAFGAAAGSLSFRYRLEGAYFALATFAFAEMIRLVVQYQPALNSTQGFRVPIESGSSWARLQFPAGSANYYFLMLGLLAAIQIVVIVLRHSTYGLYTLSIREDESAAISIGLNTSRWKTAAMALSAALTAVCGAFYFQFFFFIDPQLAFGVEQSVAILLPAIIGGTGTLWGPLVGAVILIPSGELLAAFVRNPPGFLSFLEGRSGVDLLVYAVFLILILLYMPKGVYGSLRRGEKSR